MGASSPPLHLGPSRLHFLIATPGGYLSSFRITWVVFTQISSSSDESLSTSVLAHALITALAYSPYSHVPLGSFLFYSLQTNSLCLRYHSSCSFGFLQFLSKISQPTANPNSTSHRFQGSHNRRNLSRHGRRPTRPRPGFSASSRLAPRSSSKEAMRQTPAYG